MISPHSPPVENLVMDAYVCSNENIPDELYRVNYPGSRTAFSITEGFSASDTTKVYDTGKLVEFKKAIVDQFTWSCRADLPFISLFSDRAHAENWGCKEPWHRHKGLHDDWSLHVIDTTKLKNMYHIFKLSDLLEELDLDLPVGASQHIWGAFLCLHRIPIDAIVETRSPKEVKADQEERRARRYWDAPDLDYLAGYSGSEREAMQENYNTIIEKNIENNW